MTTRTPAIEKPAAPAWTPPAGAVLQRQCACGGAASGPTGPCDECRKKRLQRQAAEPEPAGSAGRFMVGASSDPLEGAADRLADQALAAPARASAQPVTPKTSGESSRAAVPERAAPLSVDRALAEPGRPLDSGLQSDMADRFGFDFANVRVHVGSASAESARDVNAAAYTVGRDVVFGAGRYEPGSPTGRRLIAHELGHVIQQSEGSGLTGSTFSLLQRQEAPGPKKLTAEEYKKLDPSLQVLTWGPDFMKGFEKSGAASQVGDAAMVVLKKGFTQSMDHPVRFRAGVMVGIPLGVSSAVISALTSLLELGWELAKLWVRLKVTPNEVAKELADLVKNNVLPLLGAAEPLGEGVGQLIAKEATKFGIEFVNGTPFDQGLTFGKIIGRIIGEIGLLFVGAGEVSAAAKFAANTRYGRMLLEAMEASRLLKPLVESTEAAKAARAAKAAEEAKAASGALKGAQEARPEIAAAEDASKARPNAAQPGERPPVAPLKDALPPSVSKEVITPNEAVAEAAFIDAHPETIVGDAPPRAKLGNHDVVQLPEGVCERHSKRLPIPCPVKFKKKPQPKPSMLTKEPGLYQADAELGRNMAPADRAYENKIRDKVGGPPDQGYYIKRVNSERSVQFDAFDRDRLTLIDGKNWLADGRIVKALEAGEPWAAWKVVEQANDQLKVARGFAIEWHVASPEAKKVIEPIFKGWNYDIKVVLVLP
jgi:hypothetical protein